MLVVPGVRPVIFGITKGWVAPCGIIIDCWLIQASDESATESDAIIPLGAGDVILNGRETVCPAPIVTDGGTRKSICPVSAFAREVKRTEETSSEKTVVKRSLLDFMK